MTEGINEPTLVKLIMDELKQHGVDLREHSRKADISASEMRSEISKIRESQGSFQSEMKTKVAEIHGQLKEIKHKVEPLSAKVAVNADNIGELKKDKDNLYGHITVVKDAIRSNDPAKILPATSFWDGPNAGLALKIAGYIVLGLLALAGLNMAMVKDLL